MKEGDSVVSGDILAEIETDKATMEFEAVDEGTIAKILIAEGTDGVKVGEVIALIAGEGEDASAASAAPSPKAEAKPAEPVAKDGGETGAGQPAKGCSPPPGYGSSCCEGDSGDRVKASAGAAVAEAKGRFVQSRGSGRQRRQADVDARRHAPAARLPPGSAPAAAPPAVFETDIPHEAVSFNMRNTNRAPPVPGQANDPAYISPSISVGALLKRAAN